jgi:hypothetical protein
MAATRLLSRFQKTIFALFRVISLASKRFFRPSGDACAVNRFALKELTRREA